MDLWLLIDKMFVIDIYVHISSLGGTHTNLPLIPIFIQSKKCSPILSGSWYYVVPLFWPKAVFFVPFNSYNSVQTTKWTNQSSDGIKLSNLTPDVAPLIYNAVLKWLWHDVTNILTSTEMTKYGNVKGNKKFHKRRAEMYENVRNDTLLEDHKEQCKKREESSM